MFKDKSENISNKGLNKENLSKESKGKLITIFWNQVAISSLVKPWNKIVETNDIKGHMKTIVEQINTVVIITWLSF